MLKLTSFSFKCLILHSLLLDLFSESGDLVLEAFHFLVTVKLQLMDLGVKTFLVILFLLNMLALNDFLSLLCHTVELDIHSTLLEVSDLELKAFALTLDSLQKSSMSQNADHMSNFRIATVLNLFILEFNLLLEN